MLSEVRCAELSWARQAGLRSPVLCCAVLCCAVLCCAVLCCAVLCCAVLCCAVLCCAVLCYAVPCCAVPCCPKTCCAAIYCSFCSTLCLCTSSDSFITINSINQCTLPVVRTHQGSQKTLTGRILRRLSLNDHAAGHHHAARPMLCLAPDLDVS